VKNLTLTCELRDYQQAFMADAMRAIDDDGPGRYLYASPTGSGKSLMILQLLSYCPEGIAVTPRLEIVAGMLEKGGVTGVASWSAEKLAAEALQYRITTPVRFRNMLARGDFPFRPNVVIHDEAHHSPADTYQDIKAYLGGGVVEIGLTASPFRGTPKGTEDFLASWDRLTWVLDYPTAAAKGVIAVPNCRVWPLVDDDEIEVVGGEFVIREAADATRSRFAEVAARCISQFAVERGLPNERGEYVVAVTWDRATIFSVSTTDQCRELVEHLRGAGMPAEAVTQDTPRADRARIFAACEAAEMAIVQIDVVSEGVDLKLRRLIDLRPTLSPVKWLQQVGRVTRPPKPGEPSPEYICCNRNLERHGYLYDGLLPPAAIAAAQQAFPNPSRRAGARAVGVENLGRFTAAELPLADGTTGLMYQLTSVEGMMKKEYAVLLHPAHSRPIYATRENDRSEAGNTKYGKWRAVDKLPDMRGFSSAPAKTLSEKQAAWWARSAATRGLDPNAAVNRRNFAALPILLDLGVRLG
jgi:superfamily II DNA or RNA helicase